MGRNKGGDIETRGEGGRETDTERETGREREGGTGKETETETERETQRETDENKQWEGETERDWETEIHTHRDRGRETWGDRGRDREKRRTRGTEWSRPACTQAVAWPQHKATNTQAAHFLGQKSDDFIGVPHPHLPTDQFLKDTAILLMPQVETEAQRGAGGWLRSPSLGLLASALTLPPSAPRTLEVAACRGQDRAGKGTP